jgi:hypothetical protein
MYKNIMSFNSVKPSGRHIPYGMCIKGSKTKHQAVYVALHSTNIPALLRSSLSVITALAAWWCSHQQYQNWSGNQENLELYFIINGSFVGILLSVSVHVSTCGFSATIEDLPVHKHWLLVF